VRSWIKLIGAALVVAFMAAGLYTVYINFTSSGDGSIPEPTSTETGPIKVVTSTNVWASITELLGGEWVDVTSIVDDPMQDPHSYEASARDQFAVSEAELVIANGGGYDDFLDQLVAASAEGRILLKLVEVEDSQAEGPQEEQAHEDRGNEHIWYDLQKVTEVAEHIVEAIVELRPASFESVNKNYDDFVSEISNIELRVEATCGRASCAGFVATEGVGNLLLEATGLVNQTPEGLANAIEEETEVSPADLEKAQNLIKGGMISLLVMNEQVVDPVSQQLAKLAVAEKVPVIRFSEMISNPDWNYLDWMANNVDLIQQATY
jgi:zinc/manganese transport system substrate-binding protein